MKLRGKCGLFATLCASAEDPREVIILSALINRAMDRGALHLNLDEPEALGKLFSEKANSLLKRQVEEAEKLVVPADTSIVGPDGKPL